MRGVSLYVENPSVRNMPQRSSIEQPDDVVAYVLGYTVVAQRCRTSNMGSSVALWVAQKGVGISGRREGSRTRREEGGVDSD